MDGAVQHGGRQYSSLCSVMSFSVWGYETHTGISHSIKRQLMVYRCHIRVSYTANIYIYMANVLCSFRRVLLGDVLTQIPLCVLFQENQIQILYQGLQVGGILQKVFKSFYFSFLFILSFFCGISDMATIEGTHASLQSSKVLEVVQR